MTTSSLSSHVSLQARPVVPKLEPYGRIRLKEIDGLKKDQLFKHVKQFDANANGQRCMVVEPYLLTRNIDHAVEEEEEEVSHQKYNFENLVSRIQDSTRLSRTLIENIGHAIHLSFLNNRVEVAERLLNCMVTHDQALTATIYMDTLCHAPALCVRMFISEASCDDQRHERLRKIMSEK